MLLHEAIQEARKDLRLSQKKLAEMAGIQRRQLATLEAGGNVTLSTLRKVLAQLPNLETFTIDAVTAMVRREVSIPEQQEVVTKAIEAMQAALTGLVKAMQEGRPPDEKDLKEANQANKMMYSGLGYTNEDIRRDYDRIRKTHVMYPELAPGPAGELVKTVETAAMEVELEQAEAALRAQGIDPDTITDDEG